jgi:arsenate reductase
LGFKRKARILFLSSFNACRAPMAEAFTNSLESPWLEARSAGVYIRPLDDKAITVMKERGMDISELTPRRLSKDLLQWADLVVVMDAQAGIRVGSLPPHVQRRDYLFDHLGAGNSLEDYRLLRDRIFMRIKAIEGGMRMLAKIKNH